MNARRITEITLETEETFTIRRSAGAIRVPCPVCGSVLALVTPGEAAALFSVDMQAVHREIDSGHLHVQQSAGGSLLICLQSLLEAAPHLLRNSKLQINQIKEIPS